MNVHAIVVGMGSYNDLGLIRSCGEAGMDVTYLNHGENLIVPINRSRYISSFRYIKPNEIVEVINDLSSLSPKDKYVVFPASDIAVETLDNNLSSLKNKIITSHAYGRIHNLIDKGYMSELALKANLKIPKTYSIDLSKDNISDNIEFPVIIKPVSSNKGDKNDITVAQDDHEYKVALDKFRSLGYSNVLVQQYIHNDTSKEIGITGISLGGGNIRVEGYIHKIRNRSNINNFGIFYPKLDSGIIKRLSDYLNLTDYIGIFDTDFIEYNGELYFIECNFRNGAYGYALTKAGFNMPKLFAENMTGQMVQDSRKLKKTVFMEERTDILNLLDHSITAKQWFRDIIKTDVFLWWNLRDPRPILRIPYFLKKYFK